MTLHQSSNNEYHADRKFLSSSMLKLLLKDLGEFERKWVHGEQGESKPAFDVGSLTHSLILEPHKVEKDFAFFDGLRKAGDRYKEFVDKHPGKIIISAPQMYQAKSFYKAFEARAEAVRMLTSGGIAEHTMTSKVLDVPVKARADYINIEQGWIADVKTTSYPAGSDMFKETVKQFYYDLSASLYCQIAFDNYGKLFDFYFIVISKCDLICDIYKCSSATLCEGSAKVMQAIVTYKKCMETGKFVATPGKPSYDSKEYEIEEV